MNSLLPSVPELPHSFGIPWKWWLQPSLQEAGYPTLQLLKQLPHWKQLLQMQVWPMAQRSLEQTNIHQFLLLSCLTGKSTTNTNKHTGPQKQSWNQCKFISLASKFRLRCVESLKNNKMNVHFAKYLGACAHTEQTGITQHIAEVKQLQESSKGWYGSNDGIRIIDNPVQRCKMSWFHIWKCLLSPSETHSPFTQATQKLMVKRELNQIWSFLAREVSVLNHESKLCTDETQGSGEHLAALSITRQPKYGMNAPAWAREGWYGRKASRPQDSLYLHLVTGQLPP